MKRYQGKEETLSFAKDKIFEAEEALEAVLPSVAEELGWIRENLVGEILVARRNAREEASSEMKGAGRLY